MGVGHLNQGEGDRRYARLMGAAQKGDSGAYSELLREITPLLRRSIAAQRRFLPPHEIEDLVQDTLLSLHAVRATYDPARPFTPWLMTIARYRVSDGGRRYARRAAHEVAVEFLPETFSPDQTNRLGEGYGDAEALAKAVRTLPAGQRAAIEMLKIQEMSLKEASAKSGMTIGALKVSVHRAMKALHRALKTET